jgi:cell shape-determining protein MreD
MNSSIKKLGLWCLIVICGIVSICLVFISFVSLGTGFTHMQQEGFWVPVLAGILLLSAALLLFVRATKRILFHMRKDTFNI